MLHLSEQFDLSCTVSFFSMNLFSHARKIIKASLAHKYHSLLGKEKKGLRATNTYWPVDSFFHLLFGSLSMCFANFITLPLRKKFMNKEGIVIL